MYINDVARLVMNYLPSEYDLREIYIWCDEVSAMLLIEDRQSYRRVVLPVRSGTVLLPEGVDIPNIEYMTSGRTVLTKEDMRSIGLRRIYIKDRPGFIIPDAMEAEPFVTMEYLEPYTPIRLPKYEGSVMVNETKGEVTLYTADHTDFISGDSLIIDARDTSSNARRLYENVPMFDTDYDGSGNVLLILAEDMQDYKTVNEDGDKVIMGQDVYPNSCITRAVTDRTVCDAPFDSMYIDYVMAKINLYQHDTAEYNNYMTSFNSRLSAYRDWLIKRMPSDDCKLRNWW